MACTTDTTLKAGSTLWLTAAFYDKDGAAFVPSAISYDVLCLTTGTTITSGATIGSPAASVEIEITGAENAYIGTTTTDQKRRVVITATDAGGSAQVETADFYVRATS